MISIGGGTRLEFVCICEKHYLKVLQEIYRRMEWYKVLASTNTISFFLLQWIKYDFHQTAWVIHVIQMQVNSHEYMISFRWRFIYWTVVQVPVLDLKQICKSINHFFLLNKNSLFGWIKNPMMWVIWSQWYSTVMPVNHKSTLIYNLYTVKFYIYNNI